MPRIKRWFPVSHDINHSPTIRLLVRDYGAPGLRIWLEILSIADRSGPFIDCTSEGAVRRLSSAAETRFKVVSNVIDALMKCDSLRLHDAFNHITEVVNYSEYHRTEERKEVPTRPNQTRPNPTEPLKSPDRTPSADLLKMQKQKDEEEVWAAKIKKVGDRIYQTDKVKYMRLWEWIGQKRKRFAPPVILESLTRFEPYSDDNSIQWWGYLEKIITKEDGKYNARSTEAESEAHKRDVEEAATAMFGGTRLGQKAR